VGEAWQEQQCRQMKQQTEKRAGVGVGKKHGHNNKSTTISSNNEDNIAEFYGMR